MKQELSLVVAATFTAEPLNDSLGFWMRELGFPARIQFAPYNQIFQQLLDPSSIVATNRNGINIVLIRLEDWLNGNGTGEADDDDATYRAIERNVREFMLALSEAVRRLPAPYLICLCRASPAAGGDPKRARVFKRAEALLRAQVADIDSVWMIFSEELEAAYAVRNYYDAYGEKIAHIPFTPVYYTALGTILARKIYALKSAPYKVIVLDCDHTLWSGICGEDGPYGIEIDFPRRFLQEFMVRQHGSGLLLCLCSKNNEEDVIRVFENRPEMPLRQHHFVSRRINWKPKAANLISLAEELQLALDSFIFVDDDPLECAEMRAFCPEVLTLEIPREAEAIPRFLDQNWAFDHLKITDEDRKRTVLYQQNALREQLRNKSFTIGDFLAGLALEIGISPLMPQQLARAAELTQRTNQFNLTTVRRSAADLQIEQQSGRMEILAVHVKDRFGDYGLVGLIIFQADSEALCVDTFLLSCRALGRGVEYRMLARLGEVALGLGLKRVDARLSPSGKNQPAVDFMNGVGAEFRVSTEKECVFRFPASWVATLTFRPDDQVWDGNPGAQQTLASGASREYPPEALERCRLLLRIATELNHVERIHASVISQGRHSRPSLETPYVVPRDSVEAAVENIWCEVLNVDRVGAWDNFFELGGDSLLMTRVGSRIRQSFGVELSAAAFFGAPTVAGIAHAITEGANAGGHAESIEEFLGELTQLTEDDARARLVEEGFGTEERAGSSGDAARDSWGNKTDLDHSPVFPIIAEHRSVGTFQETFGPAIASVSIMTHNRLNALERALVSYIENTRSHGRSPEFVVFDDTETEVGQRRCRSMLRDVERRYGTKILYAGRRERVQFANDLVAVGGLPADIVRFALFDVERCGNAYGVSRNALMLDSVGHAVFSADDDTVCRIATSPNPVAGVRFATAWDPADLWFFPDRERALRSATFVDEDILSVHEQVLGGDVRALLGFSGNGEKPALPNHKSSFENLSEGIFGKVLATFNGLVGDCAWGSPFGDWGGPMGCLLLNGASHKRLVQSEADYRTACTTREIMRVVDRPTLCRETLFMTVFMALDNRDLLPPFFPVKRGEDILFGLSLNRCVPHGYVGQLPRALVHAPVERRIFSKGEILRSASGFDTAKLLIACIKSYGEKSTGGNVEVGLRALGDHLVELASMRASDFRETVRDQVWKNTNSFIAMMEQRLQASDGLPRFWATDVNKFIERLSEAVRKPDYCVPLDLLHGRSHEEVRELAQRLVLNFGQLLRWWPAIVEMARELRVRGQRLAKRVMPE